LLINPTSEGLFRIAWFSCFSDNFKLAHRTARIAGVFENLSGTGLPANARIG
jgi:hypothetical protein